MQGRNRYIIALEVEMTLPLASEHARNAGDLIASDIRQWLKQQDWGWGRARIESVYCPDAQFANGDFVEEVAATREP